MPLSICILHDLRHAPVCCIGVAITTDETNSGGTRSSGNSDFILGICDRTLIDGDGSGMWGESERDGFTIVLYKTWLYCLLCLIIGYIDAASGGSVVQ